MAIKCFHPQSTYPCAMSAAPVIEASAPLGAYEDPAKIASLEELVINKMQDIYPEVFKGIKKEDLWKILFMERSKVAMGKFAYEEEEPGYLQGIMKGYLYMLETSEEPLTPELYQSIHDVCAEGVSSAEEPSGIPKGFRKWEDGGEAFFLVPGETLSAGGLEELLQRYRNYKYTDETGNIYYPLKESLENPQKTIVSQLDSGAKPSIKLKPTRPETCTINARHVIELFNLADKSTEDNKLRAIARLCQDLDQLHLFVDGNIRTTGILLLNRLLLENGLMPAALIDVNMLDCLSEDEIIDLIKEGQRYFISLTSSSPEVKDPEETALMSSWQTKYERYKTERDTIHQKLTFYLQEFKTALSCHARSAIFSELASSSLIEETTALDEELGVLLRAEVDIPATISSKLQYLRCEIQELKQLLIARSATDKPAIQERAFVNIEDSLSFLKAIKTKEDFVIYAAFFLDSLKDFIVCHQSDGELDPALKEKAISYLDHFRELTSSWTLSGSTAADRIYYHIYELAHSEEESVGGDCWGEIHMFNNLARLSLALELSREELSHFLSTDS